MSEPKIPLCRSEFLQHFAISLGRRISTTMNGWRSFDAEVGMHEHEGESLERLCVWARTSYATEVCLNLWEDKTIWVSVAQLPRNGANLEISFYPDFALLGLDRMIEAFGESVSVSTRLCYDESPEPLLRQIWSFNGEVEIEGAI
jgi:hypothetical protein